jgi:hypothetical protein
MSLTVHRYIRVMNDGSKKHDNFWQELKRRKVVKAIIMYAAAAYIIIELVNNVTEPLLLPEWIATAVILLLIIAFPLVAIFSWIFDITPGGIQKTEPADSSSEKIPDKRKLTISNIIIIVLQVVVRSTGLSKNI